MVKDSSPAREIPKNFLEQSISLVERSSLKLHPVIKEVRKRLVGVNPSEESQKAHQNLSKTDDGDKSKLQSSSSPNKGNGDDDEELEEEKPDMRSVLGFLN